jgi:phage terminase large subunit-like protein
VTFAQRALGYAQDVVAGRIVACEFVRAACQRQIDDLERLPARGYGFDEAAANRICAFISALPHIKGEWAKAGRKIELEPWQCFILTTVFGWKRADGTRRFRTAYTEVARKNAKSTLSSGVGLYMLCADGEPGAEVYSAATTRDQAKIVWEDAKRMADKVPELRSFGVLTHAHAITGPQASSFKPMSSEAGTADGLNIHCAIIDELHAHPKRDLWEVIETATGARSQPLIWSITTAGSNRAGICYEQRDYASKILKGVHQDETYFGVIYTLDDADDWADESVWIKANPNLGVSVKLDDLQRKASKALQQTSAQPGFLTKHLNVWVNADQAWMDMRRWDACGDKDLRIEDFRGERCWLGCDLASKVDIAAVGAIFERDSKRYLFRWCWAPEEAIEGSRNSQYPGWEREGRLIKTDGATTDFDAIGDKIRELARDYDVRAIAFDPWQALKLMQELQGEGLPVVELRTTTGNLSEPMKQLEADVLNGQVVHEGCPMAAWMVSNVVAHVDHNDNVMPRKERPENKIDLPVAWMSAYSMYHREQDEGSIDVGQLAFG